MTINFKVDNLKSMHDELKAFTSFLLDAGVCDDDVFASKLISCELITNVIRHGGDTAFFTGSLWYITSEEGPAVFSSDYSKSLMAES